MKRNCSCLVSMLPCRKVRRGRQSLSRHKEFNTCLNSYITMYINDVKSMTNLYKYHPLSFLTKDSFAFSLVKKFVLQYINYSKFKDSLNYEEIVKVMSFYSLHIRNDLAQSYDYVPIEWKDPEINSIQMLISLKSKSRNYSAHIKYYRLYLQTTNFPFQLFLTILREEFYSYYIELINDQEFFQEFADEMKVYGQSLYSDLYCQNCLIHGYKVLFREHKQSISTCDSGLDEKRARDCVSQYNVKRQPLDLRLPSIVIPHQRKSSARGCRGRKSSARRKLSKYLEDNLIATPTYMPYGLYCLSAVLSICGALSTFRFWVSSFVSTNHDNTCGELTDLTDLSFHFRRFAVLDAVC